MSVSRLAPAALAGLLLAAALAGTPAATAQGDAPAALRAAGERMYREGVDEAGKPLTARAPANARLSGKDVACAACHRWSGYGTTEGKFAIRPITAPALRQEITVPVRSPRMKARLGVRQRPPYTEQTLARAIRTGVDAAGTPLSPAMPRYQLGDEDMRALSAYLFSLSAQPAPGVDEHDMHLATVIQPGVPPAQRRAMLDVMQAFAKDKVANMRKEEERREVGNFRRYRAYRKWVLHAWELSGPSETWGAQLEALYAKQPVFALIGGIGAASWGPIHEFSERFAVPCVLPQTDLPVVTGRNHYTVYFSQGIVLDARALAKYLRDTAKPARVLQIYRRDAEGEAAAAALREALPADQGVALEQVVLEGDADAAFWQSVFARRPEALVLWLREKDLSGAQPPDAGAGLPIYVSYRLLGAGGLDPVVGTGGDLRMIYPSDLPPRRETRLLRNKMWLHGKGIALTEQAVQMNTLFAMTIASDALGHIKDSFSRDYFLERVEHAVNQSLTPSIFAQVSLGPEQRFAAKGSTIVQRAGASGGAWKPLTAWIVP